MALLFKKTPVAQEELDKARVCGRWDQVASLEQRYKSKSISSGLRHVVRGEAILEEWLLARAGPLPAEAVEKLKSVQNEDEVVQREAWIVLGKCYWYTQQYKEAYAVLDKVKITSLENLSLHHQKLLVDFYAFYGLCQEYKGHVDDALKSYDQCLEMLIKLAIQLETCLFRSDIVLPHSVYAAIVKATVLCVSERKYKNALSYCRKLLLAHNLAWLSGLQQICSLLLAELLILHFPAVCHTPIPATANQNKQSADGAIEEAILTLSLAKTGAVALHKHDILLDHLMTLVLIEANLPGTLAEVLEETVKLSHHNGADVSQHFGLVLCAAAGKEKQAMTVMEENVKLCPHDPITILMACKTALQQRKFTDALEVAKQAVEVTKNHWLLPRAHQLLGACYAALAQQEISRSQQKHYHQSAVENMQKACSYDDKNVEMSFELALQLSEGREISAAIAEVKRALQLDNSHVNSLHLLVLLMTAEKKYKEAYDLCKFTLDLSPTNLSVWLCSVQLELLLVGAQLALRTCKNILKIWQDKYGGIDEKTTSGLLNEATKDQASLTELPFGEVYPGGVAFNEMISDTDSTMYTISTNPGDILLAKIWCLIAELFQVEGMYTDSLLACVKEAYLLAPSSPHVLTQLGKILEGSRHYTEASVYYSHAIARDPSFAPAMAHRGHLLLVEGELEQAEQCLKESVERSPLDHKAWRWLGEVFEKKGETTLALDCYMTAMDFEASAPVLPFASVTNESKL